MMKDVKMVIAIVILFLVFIISCLFYTQSKKEDEIMSYNTIVIDGQEFSTSSIKNISYASSYSRQVKIEFKDGMVAYTDCYILKDN